MTRLSSPTCLLFAEMWLSVCTSHVYSTKIYKKKNENHKRQCQIIDVIFTSCLLVHVDQGSFSCCPYGLAEIVVLWYKRN